MPQILSTPSSVLPAATVAPVAAAVVPLAPGLAQANSSAADFVGQLETALKNLTQATLPHLALPVAAQVVAAALAPGAEAAKAPADKADSKPIDKKSDLLPEVLAALGFVPVPIAFQPLAPLPEKAGVGSSSVASDPSAAPPPIMQPLPKSVLPEVALPHSPNATDAQFESSKLPKPAVQLPLPEGLSPLPAAQPVPVPVQSAPAPPAHLAHVPPLANAPTSAAPAAPAVQPVPTDPSGLALASLPVAAPLAAPAPQHAPAPTMTPGATTQVIGTQPHLLDQGAFQQGSADDGRQPTPKKAAPISEATSAQSVPLSASDLAIAAAAGSTAPNSVTVLPPHVRPAEVVAQIAHQADLYRLPGNRGVRIQLHPEGLGGVEVTMRYGVGGALQLHINVEQAATGTLVQAGWAQLRDALATQGISPDRLVMSVTAPSSSSSLDFSGGGSGRQTEPGLAGFAQSQNGQQRQDDPEQTGPRGWNGAGEPTSPTDDNPRAASTTAVTSRIDYRA